MKIQRPSSLFTESQNCRIACSLSGRLFIPVCAQQCSADLEDFCQGICDESTGPCIGSGTAYVDISSPANSRRLLPGGHVCLAITWLAAQYLRGATSMSAHCCTVTSLSSLTWKNKNFELSYIHYYQVMFCSLDEKPAKLSPIVMIETSRASFSRDAA